jgi:hypothetical protein
MIYFIATFQTIPSPVKYIYYQRIGLTIPELAVGRWQMMESRFYLRDERSAVKSRLYL